jgi:imidazolonepropionase-like amidohydrolase
VTSNLRELLAAGFTTVWDLRSRTGVGLRDAVAEGKIPGPRIFACDRIMTQTAGHADIHHVLREWMADHGDGYFTIVDGADECRREARLRLRRETNFLKMYVTGGVMSEKDAPDHQQFTAEGISAVTREAANARVPVATHAHAAAGIKTVLECGVDTIEHGMYLDDEAIDLFLERDAGPSAEHHPPVRHRRAGAPRGRLQRPAVHPRQGGASARTRLQTRPHRL